MKPEPFELDHVETTEAEFRRAIKHGGWVEYHLACPLCERHYPHRHYICGSCGKIDFVGIDHCFECWHAHEIWKMGREVYSFLRKHGASLQRLGVKFFIAILLLTIAGWRVT